MLTSIMNIKYNVDNLCRYNVKKYEYNMGSEKNNQIKMLDKVIQFSYFEKLYDFDSVFVIGSECFVKMLRYT
jgi:hypothetical protein